MIEETADRGASQPGAYERITTAGLPGMVFTRRPVEQQPPGGTRAMVEGDRWRGGGIFQDGVWCRLKGKPFKQTIRFWTIMEHANGG